MLKSMKSLGDFGLQARDGEIGAVEEFYFDDRQWTIRYLVLQAHKWLSGRKVLISPKALEKPDWEHKVIMANLTKSQIEKSPDVDFHKPASRQEEEKLLKYYGWEYYWTNPDFYLQSSKDVMGYRIEAKDGIIGKVDDFIFDDSTWAMRYMIVDTGDWLPGKKVPLAMDWIDYMNAEKQVVLVDLAKSEIAKAPAYDSKTLPRREYEIELYKYYGKKRYWD